MSDTETAPEKTGTGAAQQKAPLEAITIKVKRHNTTLRSHNRKIARLFTKMDEISKQIQELQREEDPEEVALP